MILDSTSALKLLISKIDDRFMRSGIKLKRTRLYEIFAKCQGFNTKAALVKSFPVLMDIDKATSENFLTTARQYILPANKETANWPALSGNFLEVCARLTRRFPVIAPPMFGLEIFIDWSAGGDISYPSLYHESNKNSSTFAELDGQTSSIRLGYYIEESEYNALCEELRPFIDAVLRGYSYDKTTAQGEYNEDARSSLEDMFQYAEGSEAILGREQWGALISDVYVDDDVEEWVVQEHSLTSVNINGAVLFDHATSDIQLRRVVANEILETTWHTPICPYYLYERFKGLRNACRENFLARDLKVHP